jgi:aminopeptidase N
MKIVYDSRYHLHLGYYEEKFDYEATAYKRQSEDIWDIFFDLEQYKIENLTLNQEDYKKNMGYKILSIAIEDLDYDYGVKLFERWLLENKLI